MGKQYILRGYDANEKLLSDQEKRLNLQPRIIGSKHAENFKNGY